MATRTKKTEEADGKVKQGYLPGTEPPSHPAIDEAAEAYYDLIAKGFKIRGQADKAKEELLAAMNEHKIDYYTYDNKEVVVEDKLNVKVKKKKKEEE